MLTKEDLDQIPHHPALEEIVDMLCRKTQNVDKGFFRAEVAYFLAKMASTMRAVIITKDRGEVPVNLYVLALATSGFGKGHSISIVENLMKGFKRRFMEDTFPLMADQNLWKIANDRAARQGTDPAEEHEKLEKEWRQAGAFPFTFDSGTPPAVKQLRQKLLLSNAGSINLQIDEIGSNLISSTEMLNLFLELFDQGQVKQKLVKNTAENQRAEEMDGKTPTNALLFGTPAKLFDGSTTENEFYSFLETGYARRCLFGYGQHVHAIEELTPQEIYARLINPANETTLDKWALNFEQLADAGMFGWKMVVEDDVAIALLTYKIECEKLAATFPEHEEIRKAELSHRYFKVLKLAGAYAFVDRSNEVEMHHLNSAIKLVEESGEAFQTILNREKTYVKLARYIAEVGKEVTHADLTETLPFYPKSTGPRNDMMALATAWGYKQHIIIKKSFIDTIEFYRGETLKKTDTSQMIVSYSEHWAYNYENEKVPFEELHVLTQAPGYNFANHHFDKGHRSDENTRAGFNMVVIDVDGDVPLTTAIELMKEWKFLAYTTKRHQIADPETGIVADRFRMLFPINYCLELNKDDYKEFMDSLMAWLPFESDESASQRSKKWMSHSTGSYHFNDGELLDVLPFIPSTSRNEFHKAQSQKLESLDNLERWFAQRIATGNRNNNMLKFALALVDGGMDLMTVGQQVYAFNKKLNNPLAEDEIASTIMATVAKRYQP